jgi:hypothetical protein
LLCQTLLLETASSRRPNSSLRIDIPKNDVPEENQGKDGVEYFDGDDERFSDRRPADKLLNGIFAKPGK